MWLGLPNTQEQVAVFAAELDLSSPTKWGRRAERTVTLNDLEGALDELRTLAFEWAGPGAFSG